VCLKIFLHYPDSVCAFAIVIFHAGYSQSSGRMERTGRIPICLSGIQFHFMSSAASSSDSKRKSEESRAESYGNGGTVMPNFSGAARVDSKQGSDSSSIDAAGALQLGTKTGVESDVAPVGVPATSRKSGQQEILANLERFHALMRKGVEKQMTNMTKFYKRTAERFPEKVHK
jgi:hypothetical protein